MSKNEIINIANNDNVISILAETNNIIIGICIVTIKPIPNNLSLVKRKVAYMEDLCVHENYRNSGVGTELFNEVKDRLSKLNIDSLELMIWQFNSNAMKFYENKGMTIRSSIMELKL